MASQATTSATPGAAITDQGDEITVRQLVRSEAAGRDYVDGQIAVLVQRMHDQDEATKVLHETVTRVPNDVQTAIGHLKELMIERFNSVQTQFAERDDRSRSEGVANEVKVNAAFAAQKEAAAEQNKSNTLAINKSEGSMKEAITTLGALFSTGMSALSDKVDDLKERVATNEAALNALIARGAGQREQVTEHRQSNSALIGVAAFVITIIFVLIAIIGFFKKPST